MYRNFVRFPRRSPPESELAVPARGHPPVEHVLPPGQPQAARLFDILHRHRE